MPMFGSVLFAEQDILRNRKHERKNTGMWYVVQTPVGREAETAEKLNHLYPDKADRPCFVLSKERTWRMGGIYYVDTEAMFPGYIFADTEDAAALETKIRMLPGLVKLPGAVSAAYPSGMPLALKPKEEAMFRELLRGDSQNTVRRFLVRANDAGEIEWAEGILGRMLPQIIRKRLRKRVITLQFDLLGEKHPVELAIRMEGDPTAVFIKNRWNGAERNEKKRIAE